MYGDGDEPMQEDSLEERDSGDDVADEAVEPAPEVQNPEDVQNSPAQQHSQESQKAEEQTEQSPSQKTVSSATIRITYELSFPCYARINTLKWTPEEARKSLDDEGWKLNGTVPIETYAEDVGSMKQDEVYFDPHVENLLIFAPNIQDFHEFWMVEQRYLILQDKASCLPAFLLNPRPGSQVFDTCAAPGMKTSHAAAIMDNQGKVWAMDRAADQVAVMKQLLYGSKVTVASAFCGDFLKIDVTDKKFSKVKFAIVDPPCSGSGIVKRMDEITGGNAKKERLDRLKNLQAKILKHALKLPGLKRAVYSTCSIHEEENEQVVDEVLLDTYVRQNFELKKDVLPEWTHRGLDTYEVGPKCLRADPRVTLTNGFFVAVFEKIASSENNLTERVEKCVIQGRCQLDKLEWIQERMRDDFSALRAKNKSKFLTLKTKNTLRQSQNDGFVCQCGIWLASLPAADDHYRSWLCSQLPGRTDARKHLRLEPLFQRLMETCSGLDEMPHSFDDTLIDKLVKSLEFEAESLSAVENMVRNIDFERRCIPIQMVIRLLDAAVVREVFEENELLVNFVSKSEGLLQQNRPPKLLDDLFQLYCRSEIFQCRDPDAWLGVIRWSLWKLGDKSCSVSLCRRLLQFFLELEAQDARRLLVISGVMEIFNRRTRPSDSCVMFIDVVTRFLEHFVVDLAAEECISYVESVRNARRIGENTLKLLVTLKSIHSSLVIPLTPGSWRSEANRVDVISLLLETRVNPIAGIDAFRDGLNVEIEDQLVDLLLYSPAVKFSHLTQIMDRICYCRKAIFLENLNVNSIPPSWIKATDVTFSLQRLVPQVPTSTIASLFHHLDVRDLQSSSLLDQLYKTCGPNVFDMPEFANFRNKLKNHLTTLIRLAVDGQWEQTTDTALEVANIFPCFLPTMEDLQALISHHRNSPYPMTQVLKLLWKHYGGIPIEQIQYFMLCGADPAPKLICMQYLSTSDMFDTLSVEEICGYLEAALNDENRDLREEALKLAEKAIGKFKGRIVEFLREYQNHRFLLPDVHRILHHESVSSHQKAMSVLYEMLSSLQVHDTQDDIPDRY